MPPMLLVTTALSSELERGQLVHGCVPAHLRRTNPPPFPASCARAMPMIPCLHLDRIHIAIPGSAAARPPLLLMQSACSAKPTSSSPAVSADGAITLKVVDSCEACGTFAPQLTVRCSAHAGRGAVVRSRAGARAQQLQVEQAQQQHLPAGGFLSEGLFRDVCTALHCSLPPLRRHSRQPGASTAA